MEYIAPALVAFCRSARPGGLQDSPPAQGSTSFEGLGGGLQDVLPLQGSTTLCRDGGPGGGLQNFVSQDRVQKRLREQIMWRRSEALLEASRRFWAQVEEEEAEEEEETEQMDFEEQPSRFQGHPQRWSLLAGLVVHFRALIRRAPPRWAGTMVMAAPVIMQLEFQQSVLFFSEGASESVHDQCAGHSSCMRRRVRVVQNCAGSGHARRRQWQWQVHGFFAGYASHAVFVLSVGRPVMPGIMVGTLISRRRDSTDAVLGLVVIAPVVMQRQVPCDIFQQSLATVRGASYSVHRQRGGFRRCEQRQVPEVVTQTVETPQLQFLVVLWLTCVAQCLARQWIHVHVQLWVDFGLISRIFFVNWCSDAAVDSRPAQFWFAGCALCCVPFDFRLVDARSSSTLAVVCAGWFCLC